MQLFKNKSSQNRYEKMFKLAERVNTLRENGSVSLVDVNQVIVSNSSNGRRMIKDSWCEYVLDDLITDVCADDFHLFMDKYKRYMDEVEDNDEYLFDSTSSYKNYIKCYIAAEKVNQLLLDGKSVLDEAGAELKSRFTYIDNEQRKVIELDSLIYIGWTWDTESGLIHVSYDDRRSFINTISEYKVATKFERVEL